MDAPWSTEYGERRSSNKETLFGAYLFYFFPILYSPFISPDTYMQPIGKFPPL